MTGISKKVIIALLVIVCVAGFWLLLVVSSDKPCGDWSEKTRIGTLVTAASTTQLFVSPNLCSYAYVVKQQDKFSVVYNGSAGPLYDYSTYSERIILSSDGKQFAYTVYEKTTGKKLVVFNGKEGNRYDWIYELRADSKGNILYEIQEAVAGENQTQRVQVINGKEQRLEPFLNYSVSPDGGSYAYQEKVGDSRRIVYVGGNGVTIRGKEYFDTSTVTWSPSGKHFAYSAKLTKSGPDYVVVDGKEEGPYEQSYRFIFKWSQGEENFAHTLETIKDENLVIVNGVVTGRYSDTGTVVSDLVFNHYGSEFAYKVSSGGKQYYVVNGKEVFRYDYLSPLTFDPDGSGLAYALMTGGKLLVIRDDEIMKSYGFETEGRYIAYGSDTLPIVYNKDGKHLAYPGFKDANYMVAILDGKEGEKYDYVYLTRDSFSQNGKYFTYIAVSGDDIFRLISPL